MSFCGGDSEAFWWWYSRNRDRFVPALVVALVVVVALVARAVCAGREVGLRRQREVTRDVEKLGGEVQFVGDRYQSASLRKHPNGDEVMNRLVAFEEWVSIDAEGSTVTDEDLRHVVEMRELKFLNPSDTRVTDAGMVHLWGLPITRASESGLGELRRSARTSL